jgi:hypothetical protein
MPECDHVMMMALVSRPVGRQGVVGRCKRRNRRNQEKRARSPRRSAAPFLNDPPDDQVDAYHIRMGNA